MGEDRACKPDDPVMKAWESYSAVPANSAQWVRKDSTWAAFSAGFRAGQAPQAVVPQPDNPRWPQPGDWMKYLGKNGHDFERTAATKVFEIGGWYEVEGCGVYSFSNHIKLKWIDGYWNGVMFERCNEDGSPIIPVNTVPMSLLGQKPDKLVCNVQPCYTGEPGRVICVSCGNTWAASLGVTGCVQGGHGGFAEPRRDGQLPEPEQPGGHVDPYWKWLSGENARLRHDAVEAMKAVQADNERLCVEHTKALEGELLLRMDLLEDNERLNSENARVAAELAEKTHELERTIERGSDQWRGKDRAQMRAGRLWKALCNISGYRGGLETKVLRDITDKALREDAAITAGVEPKRRCDVRPIAGMSDRVGCTTCNTSWEASLGVKGCIDGSGHQLDVVPPSQLRDGPGRDECDGLTETVGDAKEFDPKHEKLLNCPGCHRNDGEHDVDCPTGHQYAIKLRDPPPPRMVQIALLPQIDGSGSTIYGLDDRGRIWCRGDRIWFELVLPDGFET